nr:uncharacterized protein LOC105467736 [Macaca nemestrina]
MESITAMAGESVSARGQVFARWRGHPYALPPSSSTSPRALGPGSSNKVTLDWGRGSTTLFSGPKINLPVISANETWNASRPEDGKGSGFDKRRPAWLGILSPAGWKMQRCFQRGAEELRGKK